MTGPVKMQWLGTQTAHWCIVAAAIAAGAAWLSYVGPFPVVRVSTPIEELAPFWYMLLPFAALGMLVAELAGVVVTDGMRRTAVGLSVAVVVLIVASQARLSFRLPLSGHAFILTYLILRRAFLNSVAFPSRRSELWIAIAMAAGTAYVKLAWWDDPITLLVGAAAGALLFIVGRARVPRQSGGGT